MTNHPNRAPAYRVQMQNGRFDHVRGKANAITLAVKMIEAAPGPGVPKAHQNAATLDADYGIRLTRLSEADAAAVGL